MWDLVEYLEDQFSHMAAHFFYNSGKVCVIGVRIVFQVGMMACSVACLICNVADW